VPLEPQRRAALAAEGWFLAPRAPAFYADFKANAIPLFEAEKSAGLIVSYRCFLNQTVNSTEDWDFGYAIVYQNMAAL
jgi:hypothetical protein